MPSLILYDRLYLTSGMSPEFIRQAILERLGVEQVTAPSGRFYYLRKTKNGFQLSPVWGYSNSSTFRLITSIELEPCRFGTIIHVRFRTPGVFLMCFIYVAVAIWMRTAPWKMLLGMTAVFVGLHLLAYLLYCMEKRTAEIDLRDMLLGAQPLAGSIQSEIDRRAVE